MKGSQLVGMKDLVRFQVGNLDSEQVIEVAGDVVAFEHFRDLSNAVLEALNVFALMPHEAYRDKGGQGTTAGIWIDDRPIAANHPLVLETSQSS